MNSKRNTLRKIAAVSALATAAPSSWTKPVINSVILPAHAQTSPNILGTVTFKGIEIVACSAGPSIRENNGYAIDDSDRAQPEIVSGDEFNISYHRTVTDENQEGGAVFRITFANGQGTHAVHDNQSGSDTCGFVSYVQERKLTAMTVGQPNGTVYDIIVSLDFGFIPGSGRTIVLSDLVFTPRS